MNRTLRLLPLLLIALARPAAAQSGPAVPPGSAPPALEVDLVSPGAGPHAPLRFRPAAGTGATIDMTMSMSMQQRLGGAAMPVQMVSTRYTVDAYVLEVTAAGDIRYRFEYTAADIVPDPGVPADVLESMRGALRTIVGLRVTGAVSDRGIPRGSSIEPPPGLSSMVLQYVSGIEQLLDDMTAPLPHESIGVGAEWTATRTLLQDGLEVRETSRYTLAAYDGDTVEIHVEQEQVADPQPVPARGTPGMMVDLLRFDSKGRGRTVLRLSRLFPSSTEIDIVNESAVRMNTSGGAGAQTIDRRAELSARMKERP